MVLLNYLDTLPTGDNCHGQLFANASGAFADKGPLEYYGTGRANYYNAYAAPYSVNPTRPQYPRKPAVPTAHTGQYDGWTRQKKRRAERLDRRYKQRTKRPPLVLGRALAHRRRTVKKRMNRCN